MCLNCHKLKENRLVSTSSGPAAPEPQPCTMPIARFSRPAGQSIELAVLLPFIQASTWAQ